MPCYSPPPPFEGEERRSAEQAARLLCEMVTTLIREKGKIPRSLLEWWLVHRRIDAKVAKNNMDMCGGGRSRYPDSQKAYLRHLKEASEADADVALAEELLREQSGAVISLAEV